jgi:hypothetical protein
VQRARARRRSAFGPIVCRTQLSKKITRLVKMEVVEQPVDQQPPVAHSVQPVAVSESLEMSVELSESPAQQEALVQEPEVHSTPEAEQPEPPAAPPPVRAKRAPRKPRQPKQPEAAPVTPLVQVVQEPEVVVPPAPPKPVRERKPRAPKPTEVQPPWFPSYEDLRPSIERALSEYLDAQNGKRAEKWSQFRLN